MKKDYERCKDCCGCGWIVNPNEAKVMSISVPYIRCKKCKGEGRIEVKEEDDD